MCDRRWSAAAVLLLVSLTGRLSAQEPTPWHDPSPHKIQFVTVDKDVKLEVLDWGGTGRPIVLLTGLGNTAHVFDDFAPKLTSEYHVYGLTRRGFGASSAPVPANSNYSADRLGDDVLAVLDALKLDHPVLVGHSIAGEELSSVATRHPERIAGLIYLDAGFSYAYYDRSRGDFTVDWDELKKSVDQMQSGADQQTEERLIQALLQMSLPAFEKDVHNLQDDVALSPPPNQMAPPPAPTAADRATFAAWRLYQKNVSGYYMPESELRQNREPTPDGHVGPTKPANSQAAQAITQGEQKYEGFKVPTLAIFAVPHDPGPYADAHSSPAALAAFDAANTMISERFAKAFESGIPSARVVRLPHAAHYVFLSNEADVLRKMRAFLTGLH